MRVKVVAISIATPLLGLVLGAWLSCAHGKSELPFYPHEPYVITSESGSYYLKSKPGHHPLYAEAITEVFAVARIGPDTLIWSAQGVLGYPSELFLSADGHCVVVVRGIIPRLDYEAAETAIAFYADGKIVREYQIGELIEGYNMDWHSGPQTYLDLEKSVGFVQQGSVTWFQLTTNAGVQYTFDSRTGEIVNRD